MQLDLAAAERAMQSHIAKPLGMTTTQAASGILRIAAAAMSHAVKGVTTDRGLDTGAFPYLFAYGGAGPLHASMVARELRIPHVVIPRAPGHFSAFGMLLADFRRDLVRSHFITLAELSLPQLDAWFGELEAEGLRTLDAAEVGTRKIMVQRHLDMRYIGQEHAVTVEIPAAAFKRKNLDALKAVFDEAHRERYGRGSPNEPAEIVSLRSTVIGVLKKPVLETIRSGTRKPGDVTHDKEHCAQHGFVAAEQQRFWHGKSRGVERAQDPVLAIHRMRGFDQPTGRLAPQDIVAAGRRKKVGGV
jgi:N-methylhydantoinase A